LKTSLSKAVNAVLGRLGYELRPKASEAPPFTMDGILDRARKRGTNFRTVVDVGAAAGRWTRKALRYFPEARFLLVEPLEERRPVLDVLRQQHPNVEFALAAAGDRPGSATLHVAEDLDGSGIYSGREGRGRSREVAVTTIDAEITSRALPPPYFLKFDTHGFELPILAGAAETLPQTSMLVLEAYNFHLSDGALRFHEMCAHMETLGFRCADLADPMLRPRDDLLWQLDLVFLPGSSPSFSHRNFH
jgi:FkbM family methyltransferase